MQTTLQAPLKFLLAIGLCFFGSVLLAQPKEVLSVPSARAAQAKSAPIGYKATQMINLPFRDDFSKAGARPDSSLWEDAFVFVNRTLAEQPPSIGVATFDGINDRGSAYDVTSLSSDTCDMLTSKPINLSNTTGQSILSFWFQPQGKALVEAPENIDSLALYFFNPSSNSWSSVWRESGRTAEPFRYVAIPIATTFLKQNFQFRFVSYGAQAGAYDVWHLDYLVLDDQRSLNDTIIYDDAAFTAPQKPLLNNYSAVPWFHFPNLPIPAFKDSLMLSYIYHTDGLGNGLVLGEYTFRLKDVNGTSLIQTGPQNFNLRDGHETKIHETYWRKINPLFSSPYNPTDEFSILSRHYWNGVNPPPFIFNDTLKHTQHFKNYYAYDDGTAERGYGVESVPGALTIAKYDVLANASLKGLYLNFIPANVDITQNTFKIVVYENNAGLPGSLIYESDSDYVPVYTDQNFYLPFVLDTSGIDLANSVFIGVKQETGARLNIGFDINSVNQTTFFFGAENNLYQSFLEGTLMMRPFFNYLPADLSTASEELVESVNVQLYPNPANTHVSVKLAKGDYADYAYRVFNINGQLLLQDVLTDRIDVSTLPNGLYSIKIQHLEVRNQQAPMVQKLIIRH
jgi:hypothetical protein